MCVCVGGKSETNFGSSGALWMSAMPCCSKGVSWIEQRCRATLAPCSHQTFHRRSHAQSHHLDAAVRRWGQRATAMECWRNLKRKGEGGQIQ